MSRAAGFAAVMLAVIGTAALLRLGHLDHRMMHGDEANQAVKFGRLLGEGRFVYDPREHHGPTLCYLALPVAWLTSAGSLAEVSEIELRLVPALAGIGLVVLGWFACRELGFGAVFWSALFVAVSPAMVFFSRYFIQEMLLVFFTFGAIVALWRSIRTPPGKKPRVAATGRGNWLLRAGWLAPLGFCLGTMHATKETCVLAMFAMAVAAAFTLRLGQRFGARRILAAGLVVLLLAAGVSALWFSSFLDNPRGVVDSYAAYGHYVGRASGEGSAGSHHHPPHYYFQVLFWWTRGDGPVRTEAAIGVLALVGLVASVRGRGLPSETVPMARFLSVYTVVLTAAYSVLAYKTPWCALGFLHGMLLLAGVGASVLVRGVPGYVLKTAAVGLLLVAAGHLAWQAHRASYVDTESADNPFAYAHTTREVLPLVEKIRQIAAAHPKGESMPIQVICPNDDYWPLPWYLRGFSRVGWYAEMPRGRAAPLIVTRPECEQALATYLYVDPPPGERPLYMQVDREEEAAGWQLRPNVTLRLYARRDLWEAFQAETLAAR